jgi:hypothetical protein
MKSYNSLLKKYLQANSSLEDENELRIGIQANREESPESLMFDYFNSEKEIPAGLEEIIFNKILERGHQKRKVRRLVYSLASIAASVVLSLGFYFDFRSDQLKKMDSNFALMENALYRVSESIQPGNQEEMLVLWVDDNVEIIIK